MSAKGKALVTGGGSGIGLAIAQRLDELGYAVVVSGRNADKLRASGFDHVVMDVADVASVNDAAEKLGTLSVVVSNAGIAPTAPALKTSDEMWDDVIATNLTGAFRIAKAFLPAMAKNGSGRFIAIGSTASLRAYRYTMAYAASKHGLLGMVKTLALELAGTGVTCNAVCPGFSDTAIVQGAVDSIASKTDRSKDEALSAFTQDNPMGRLVAPEEVANCVEWLCSDLAASVNGAAIPVDGGELAG